MECFTNGTLHTHNSSANKPYECRILYRVFDSKHSIQHICIECVHIVPSALGTQSFVLSVPTLHLVQICALSAVTPYGCVSYE
jgi:hypothetical protein